METIKDVMIRHIRAHNKKFSIEYLKEIDPYILVYEVHPLYRDYFNKLIKDKENEKN